MKRFLYDSFHVGKPTIALAATFSVLPGYFLSSGQREIEDGSLLIFLLTGTFLLAFAAAAFNNVQDAKIDGITPRTENRPLPSRRLKKTPVLLFSIGLTFLSLGILKEGVNAQATLLGVLALILYNGIYTPLKRFTAWAFLPGSLVGALPPLMGNAARGGSWNRTILWVAIFYIVWQIPHVFLILLRHEKDSSQGVLPVLQKGFPSGSMVKITFVWILSLGAYVLLAPLFVPGLNAFLLFALTLGDLWMIESSLVLLHPSFLQKETRPIYDRVFLRVNLLPLIAGTALALQGISG